jgi:hypothetical protein
MPYALATFGFTEMMSCRARLRSLFDDEPGTLAEGAERVVRFFHRELTDDRGDPACALVRFFKTHPYRHLDPELQSVALAASPGVALDEVRCLTLVATAGDEPEWNDRERSRGHRIIPLTSVEMVEKAPMISQLIKQMGLSISAVLRPDPGLLLERSDAAQNVFYVPMALGSPHIVAQDFVMRYGIASVLGFGGLVASGDMFATILFSRIPISPKVADLFKIVGLNLRIAVLPLMSRPLFPA